MWFDFLARANENLVEFHPKREEHLIEHEMAPNGDFVEAVVCKEGDMQNGE